MERNIGIIRIDTESFGESELEQHIAAAKPQTAFRRQIFSTQW